MTSLFEFLESRGGGAMEAEEVLRCFLPLARQVVQTHEAGQVAPLDGIAALRVAQGKLWFEDAARGRARQNRIRVRELTEALDGRAPETLATGVAGGGPGAESLERPVYLAGYRSWEHVVGHHDPLTDIYVLGLVLSTLACGVDLRHDDDMSRFVAARERLRTLEPRLNPVIAKAIFSMTHLRRGARPPDLQGVISSLERYRERDVDLEFELGGIEGYDRADPASRRRMLLERLQERLFEISRRNRLLHFKPTQQSVNLTYASVPVSQNPDDLEPERILVFDERLRQLIASGQAIALNKFLNFEEALYLPGALDRIRTEGRRDQAEFGLAQLRLVLCFLNWSDVREEPFERFDSPLVLLPVALSKKRAVRDRYWIQPQGTEAEINPVVRYQLKKNFGLELPESVDLAEEGLEATFEFLAARLRSAGVTLRRLDRPRPDVVVDRARRRLDQYRRRAEISGRSVRRYDPAGLEYSYEAGNYHPLGLGLFRSFVRPLRSARAGGLEGSDQPATGAATAAPARPRRVEESEPDPFTWDFDLCRVTFANFRYRKMSLVRDFDTLVETDDPSPSFDAVFATDPRPADSAALEALPWEERYDVLECDPTQARAVARARARESYIIEGPPGTGKSQTITNLIVDFVARGQRVLFVCEKRAAIDVVYHRLRELGLDSLCCLIHDSQADKKECIFDLRDTYESFLADSGDAQVDPEAEREASLRTLDRDLKPLVRYSESMAAVPEVGGVPLRRMLARAVALEGHEVDLDPSLEAELPAYRLWVGSRERLERLATELGELAPDGVFARHPLQPLSARILEEEWPREAVTGAVDRARDALEDLVGRLEETGLDPEVWRGLAELGDIFEYARRVERFAAGRVLPLLEPESDPSRAFERRLHQLEAARQRVAAASVATRSWRRKPAPEEVRNALDLARRVEAAWLPFLSPSWWRMRAFLRRAYDFDVHAVRPSWTRILEDLAAENQQRAALAEVEEAVRGQFGIEGSIASFAEGLAEARRFVVVAPDVARRCHHVLLGRPDAGAVLRRLFELEPLSAELAIVLGRFLERARTLSFARLDEVLDAVEGSLSELDDFLCCLTEVVALPPALAGVLRRAPCTLPALECSILARSISRALEGQRAVKRYRARTRARQMARVGETFRHWQRWNARVVRRRVEQRFRENVRQASLPASQLAGEEREAKNVYNRGRRALEHEFGKTMRFRSIRDLLAGDSGCVIRDLKPVWLMSPLSVADSLPLAADQFDAVIFDEASQITVEEAVPCLFRAPHFIVVGDRMQLPPTNFFSSRQVDAEGGAGGDAEEEIPEYDLDSHSFLHQVSQKLPSTMLGWHYRSRSEALISFSNAAFYRGELLTVPQRRRLGSQWGPIAVESPEEDAAAHVGALLERPISFHYLPGGVYQKRRNRDEARYIAGLVRELLRGEHGLSLAVVAFSQPQQSEIELALDELAREDAAFARRLETEFEREEEDQHRGLLVKNLENVQGDERDVVILSVCYGYDARRKMRMHFGPINQRGGEKRLNVAFSRARRHMVVVSSIRHGDITNDYNDGAGCLKNYLRYAEQVSCGAAEEAADVLREMSLRERRGAGRAEDTDEVVASIGAALRERGYLVDTAVGQSHFRCDLAVRVEGEQAYRVAILVDTDSYYAESDIIQRDLLKPRLLREAGWNVVGVFTRDWLDDRERVLKDIEQALARGEPVGRAKPREPV